MTRREHQENTGTLGSTRKGIAVFAVLTATSLMTTVVTAIPAHAAPVPSAPLAIRTAAAPAPSAEPAPPIQPGRFFDKLDDTTLAAAVANAPATQKKLRAASSSAPVFVQLAPAESRQGAASVFDGTYRTALRQNLRDLPNNPTTQQRRNAENAATNTAATAARSRKSTISRTVDSVVSQVRQLDSSARKIYDVTNALPGVVLSADADALATLAARADVVKISSIVPKRTSNASAAQLTRVLDTWQDTGRLGDGVTIGIIDTGIDYTHADFGGIGTTEAYEAADSEAANWRATLPVLARAKIVGGIDFVGDNYNADPDSDHYQPVPHLDPNPLDCNEHGTHVAGTLAGYGVNGDGSTFTGVYSSLDGDDLDAMLIGPGMAPAADLYIMKVFGCEGSTDVVIEALDHALDPNGDGDFSDRLDIVNLSLGADYATADDPENDVVDELAARGVLPVIAMGNAGDLTDVGGSPGNAVRALAVASSVDASQLLSGIRVNGPTDVAGVAVGQVSVAYDWSSKPDVTGDVVPLTDDGNLDGCDPLNDSDAAAVAGKIAWLTWDSDDATRRCGSTARAANVKAAGAIGAIFTGDVPVFTAGISGDEDIPVFQLTLPETERLQAAAVAGSLNVTFTKDLLNNQFATDSSIADLVSSFSSRGPHGSIGVVKPDVTAPGDTIASAGMGTGNGTLVISGTSMATPHVAGIAALAKEAHPAWTPEQLKAAVMNTAANNLHTEANQSGKIYGPARVGSGRVDALNAVSTSILAYSSDTPGAVSASFGVVEVPAGKTITVERHVTVQNTGSADATIAAPSYMPAIDQPGVTYTVSPTTDMTIPAGETATITVTLTAVADQLRHTIDPTMQAEQSGIPRQFVSDASGWLLAGSGLRVPVYSAAKPVSSVTASARTAGGADVIALSGTGFEQDDSSDPDSWTSLVSVMEFGAQSPKLPMCGAAGQTDCTVNRTAIAGDIRYVGAGIAPDGNGSLEDGWLWFGVSTYGNAATIGNSTIPYVDFDVDGDGEADYEVYAQNVTGTDVLVAWLVDLNAGEAIDAEPVNANWGDVDTNVFDSNVMLLPVWPALVGITDDMTSFPISYTVGMNSYYTNNESGDIDTVGPVEFDAGAPAVGVSDILFSDQGGTHVPVTIAQRPAKALVLHLHNASGTRAEVVTFAKPSTPGGPGGPGTPSPPDEPSGFPDVPASSPFAADIDWLVGEGITQGYADGTFQPGRSVTRGQMAAFLYRFLHRGDGGGPTDATCGPGQQAFPDVPTTSPFCGDVAWLVEQGVTKGYADGTFRPSDPVTRQSMAMFLYRAVIGGADRACAVGQRDFTDIARGSIACGDIEYLAGRGIVQGYPDGTYRPATTVTRGQMAAFLHRAAA